MSSDKNASKPPMKMDDGHDDSFFGVGKNSNIKKPAPSGFGKAESFGGGSRYGGSNIGSRKSFAEAEADDFDALLDDIVKPEPAA